MSKHNWQSRVFGQSTDLNFTSTLLLPAYAGKIGLHEARVNGDGSVTLESRGGKITGGHDGLLYYYVELDPRRESFILTADVFVENYGREGTNDTPQQCGFGLMARDTVGPARREPYDPSFQEIPAPSNMVYLGLFAGNRDENVLRVTRRRGVYDPGELVGVTLDHLDLPFETKIVTGGKGVRMVLGRDEKGFFAAAETAGGGMSEPWYVPDCPPNLLEQQDPAHMYIGFFASRNAQVRFENIDLRVTDYAAPDPAPALWVPVNDNVKPTLYLRSGAVAACPDYALTLQGNEDGEVDITTNGVPVGTVSLADEKPAALAVSLTPGENVFDCLYRFGETALRETFTVSLNGDAGSAGALYAAPDGEEDGAGTRERPLSLSAALRRVEQGGTVYLLGGDYAQALAVTPELSGGLDRPKTICPAPGEKPRILGGLALSACFWHVRDLEFTKTRNLITGSFNLVENCVFHDCDETGLMIGRGHPAGFNFAWPSHNTVRGCESFGNIDPKHMNADGFAAKVGVGPGNVFETCVSHDNVDDGYDLYNKVEGGKSSPVVLRGCVAYRNGIWTDPADRSRVILGGGGGNGFKVGGEGLPVGHVLEHCVAFRNLMAGFSDNFNPGALRVTGCVSVDNEQQNFIFRDNPLTAPAGVYRDNISIRTAPSDWPDAITGDADESNRLWRG